MAGNFLFSSVLSVFRLQEMEELYEAKCREGEVGNIILSLSSDKFVLMVLLRSCKGVVDSCSVLFSIAPFNEATKDNAIIHNPWRL